MKLIKKYFSMYTNLPKEIYVLAFGKIMTSMGALIWPMFTLIMSNKLGMNSQTIGLYMMIFSIFMIPCNLVGGKLADNYNKKHIIVIFDLIGNSLYLLCAFLPISMNILYILALASIFQQIEQPSYDALIADLTDLKDREKAYSLNYFAMNLGLVLAPTIGGLLFNDYLNIAFLINGLMDLSSTILILLLIKNVKSISDSEAINEYESSESGSLIEAILNRKILILLFLMISISSFIYSEFNFVVPLHMDDIFGGSGAFKFGILTSINALVVILGTPIITKKFNHLIDLKLMMIGQVLESIGLMMFIIISKEFMIATAGVILFTVGEIFLAISSTPYLTKRIPQSHRGRFLGLMNIFSALVGSLGNYYVGGMIDSFGFSVVWILVAILGLILWLLYLVYMRLDRKVYPNLYLKR